MSAPETAHGRDDATPFGTFDPWTATWDPDTPSTAPELAAWHLQRAWATAESLVGSNPFFRSRGVLPAGRDTDAFQSLPLVRKPEIVADCSDSPPFGSRTTADWSDIRNIVETSGTSGRGVEVYALTSSDLDAITRAEAAGFLWSGIGPGTRVLLTLPVGVSAAGSWYYAALRFLGANVIAAGAYPTDRKVELLERYRAQVVIGTPTYVQRLAVACDDAGLDPRTTSVETLVVAGQPFSREWALGIQERWDAVLYEQYGCTERALAWTCPGGVVGRIGKKVLHFPPENAFCEVIDPVSGRHVGDGESGELVVTPFGADGSPLLRYATGDRVRYRAPGSCECGRPLAGIAPGEVERYDDMMKIRGINLWPARFDEAVFGVPHASDYRGVVRLDDRGAEVIEVRVEGSGDPVDLQEAVTAAVRKETGLAARVSVVPVGTLAREVPEGFVKVKRFHDMREMN